ncbi:MAG: BLUF domain-containing protein [Sphingobium sp.]|uniref:BLUF domain-containing protein n=1 Tax=Sphingobium sp. TaxID=1912891 RepID=UPI0029BB0FAC|nr:BLUF domain-containing protein [Sphingobium sp.]MDX3909803.1 BLUF domain-containing protein [Sphingobium sp.]
MPELFQLTYISSARVVMTLDDCNLLLAKARINNRRLNVTGALLFNTKRFLQAIEGEQQTVRALFDRISKDTRHNGIVLLNERMLEERQFGRWAMAFDDGSGETALRDRISALLANTDPSTRALFETTATLHRAAG